MKMENLKNEIVSNIHERPVWKSVIYLQRKFYSQNFFELYWKSRRIEEINWCKDEKDRIY